MEKNKIVWSLIIVVAVVVIIESVVIIGRLGEGQKITISNPLVKPTVEVKKNDAVISLTSADQVWKVGVSNKVNVDLRVERDLAVDGIDLFIKYDPTKVTVKKLSFDGGVKPTLNKIKKESGLVIANYLILDKDGMKLTANKLVHLMSIDVVSKVAGPVQFEVATGKSSDGSVTMIIENGTSKEVGLTTQPLTVNVK